MHAGKREFAQIINGHKQFVIPVFQRDYAWGPEQCDRMWEDVLKASTNVAVQHFLGSFVYVQDQVGAGFASWLVIDGQQRLTTLTLLMVALRDHMEEVGRDGNVPSVAQIDDVFLKNRFEIGARHYRIALRRHDDATLRVLIDGSDPDEVRERSEAILSAYERFREHLRDADVDPRVIYEGVHRLVVIDVTLEHPVDNPQEIFESLNSTGVDLTQSDLIRNYLLMGLNAEEQTQLYEQYWSKLEDVFRNAGGGFEEFLRDYIAMNRRSTTQIRANRVYSEFKRFWHSSGFDEASSLLSDMLKMGRYYAWFLRPSLSPHQGLVSALKFARDGSLGTVHAALVSRLYEFRDCGRLSDGDFAEAMTLLKSYLLRRAVLGWHPGNYWNVFQRVVHALEEEAVFETFKVALVREKAGNRFPSNEEFLKGVQERDLYSMRVCRHVLDTLENHGQDEVSPLGDYSIEHVMPQALDESGKWETMLGDDWEEIHRTWLHRLGNLTLVGYGRNPSLSNLSFLEKREHSLGFRHSAVRLNRYIREQDKWTETEMRERGAEMALRAIGIWPYPEADVLLVQDKDVAELKARSVTRDISGVSMSAKTRALLNDLRDRVQTLGEVISVVENRSLCFYDGSGDFFAEFIPMKGSVRLLVPGPFEELEDSDGIAADAKRWAWIPHAVHDCGAVIDVWNSNRAEKAFHLLRGVYARFQS
ncbi:MAG: DUF262 domain-containing protein [Caldilineaceae bacterium SB0665_bin_21]|nr:DUF262 domain-containing protein [Caldilineaceae bacterium SB0665_bin_21]